MPIPSFSPFPHFWPNRPSTIRPAAPIASCRRMPSCKAALFAVLAVAQMSIGALARADQPETAGLILHDLGRKAQAYATGTVTADPGLVATLASLEKVLKTDAAALRAGDMSRTITDALILRSQALRGRAASAPREAALAGKFWAEVGVELASIVTAAKNSRDNSASAPGASDALAQAMKPKMEDAATRARAKSAALTEVGRRMASGEIFGAISSDSEPPPVNLKPAPAEFPPLGETWPSKRIPADLADLVRDASAHHDLDEAFFRAVVWAEGGRLGDRPSGSARGPAQITRSAATEECPDLGWKAVSSQDAANIDCSARILRRRQSQYLGEDADLLLTASLYNTKRKHWKRIADKRAIPPFRETVAYVTRISRYYCQITGRRLLDPARHLDNRMIALSKRVDREMENEIIGEKQAVRSDCSPY